MKHLELASHRTHQKSHTSILCSRCQIHGKNIGGKNKNALNMQNYVLKASPWFEIRKIGNIKSSVIIDNYYDV